MGVSDIYPDQHLATIQSTQHVHTVVRSREPMWVFVDIAISGTMQGIRASHEEFRYGDGRPGSRATEVFTSLTSGTAGQDCGGHGTHVAATVGGLTFGPAKNVTLLAVRALDCLGNGTVAQVIQGLEWVKDNFVAPAAVVMALGGM